MYNVLVCDDDREIVEAIEIYLSQEGYKVLKAYDGEEALKLLDKHKVDLLIIDVMMPRLDGIRATLKIREKQNMPIIILSAKSEDADKILGLNVGADDYMSKPFSMEELLLRIEAVLRRSTGLKPEDEQEIFKIGKLTFNSKKQTLFDGEEEQKLTTKESELLKLLCQNVNKVLERNYALKNIWADDNYFNARSMDVYITKLRKHLKKDPSVEIINVHGKGYKLIL